MDLLKQLSSYTGAQGRLALLGVVSVTGLIFGAFQLFGSDGLIITCGTVFAGCFLLSLASIMSRQSELLPLDQHEASETILEACKTSSAQSAMIALKLDRYEDILEEYGHETAENCTHIIEERIIKNSRTKDVVRYSGQGMFYLTLAPAGHLDLETVVQLCLRLQNAAESPLFLSNMSLYSSLSIGFCMAHAVDNSNVLHWKKAAQSALIAAQNAGDGNIRAYQRNGGKHNPVVLSHTEASDRVLEGLARQEFEPWFQPQIEATTGKISGFEALARWHHPEQGVLAPSMFLTTLIDHGKATQLRNAMLSATLKHLRQWDLAGLDIPSISINVTEHDLRDPELVQSITWELDRYNIDPSRIAIEILENTCCDATDDMITRNITLLSDMGCRIELDDFGRGYSTLSALRYFHVDRIKVDRSYVKKLDQDSDQRALFAAAIDVAKNLNITTVAEGVETDAEYRAAVALGCSHLQGYGISRPMAPSDVASWVKSYRKTTETGKITQLNRA